MVEVNPGLTSTTTGPYSQPRGVVISRVKRLTLMTHIYTFPRQQSSRSLTGTRRAVRTRAAAPVQSLPGDHWPTAVVVVVTRTHHTGR